MQIIDNIRRLSAAHIEQLSQLMRECVALGASIGFTDAETQYAQMVDYWQSQAHQLILGNMQLCLAVEQQTIIGVVGIEPCCKPNGFHRGEIFKLMVSPRFRGQGIARQLMQHGELIAREQGLTLLTLDTRSEDITVPFYLSLDWQIAGEIPLFALSTTGRLESTTLMFKILS